MGPGACEGDAPCCLSLAEYPGLCSPGPSLQALPPLRYPCVGSMELLFKVLTVTLTRQGHHLPAAHGSPAT